MLDISEYECLRSTFDNYLKVFESTLVSHADDDEEDEYDFKAAFKELFDTIGMVLNKYADDVQKDNWLEREGNALIFGSDPVDL